MHRTGFFYKPVVTQIIKEFPAFYETQKSFPAFATEHPVDHTMSHVNPTHTFTPTFNKHFNITLLPMHNYRHWSLRFRLPD